MTYNVFGGTLNLALPIYLFVFTQVFLNNGFFVFVVCIFRWVF